MDCFRTCMPTTLTAVTAFTSTISECIDIAASGIRSKGFSQIEIWQKFCGVWQFHVNTSCQLQHCWLMVATSVWWSLLVTWASTLTVMCWCRSTSNKLYQGVSSHYVSLVRSVTGDDCHASDVVVSLVHIIVDYNNDLLSTFQCHLIHCLFQQSYSDVVL